ncbi:hypothetical protein Mpsy_1390 [Methanolobus psychrophilus R15]|nr:hypothetical protein Mpsy_1390 [Methanolobus psychrophilus R15]
MFSVLKKKYGEGLKAKKYWNQLFDYFFLTHGKKLTGKFHTVISLITRGYSEL